MKEGMKLTRNARINKAVMALLIAVSGVVSQSATADERDKVLRVCQDPNNMPFSNREKQGFENRIAEFFGQELGWKVEYTWYPQRMGFIKNTLRSKQPNSDTYKCDLVTAVSPDFEMGLATRPYYHSSYSMAYRKGNGLDGVNSLEDLLKLDPVKRKSLRLGVFARSPVLNWLLQHDMMDQVVPYQTQTGDPDQYPGEVVEKDLANGKIDVAFIWGPIASYFAKRSTAVPIGVVPLKPRTDSKLDFSIAMGVRHGDKAFRDRIDQLIEKNPDKIRTILAEYGVPLLDERGEWIAGTTK